MTQIFLVFPIIFYGGLSIYEKMGWNVNNLSSVILNLLLVFQLSLIFFRLMKYLKRYHIDQYKKH